MAEDALDYEELQIHLATQLGVAYYGTDGDEAAQPPTDTPTLTRIKELVNGAIRMLLNDAPPEGWRWQQPTASLVLWATVTTGVVTVSGAGNTIMTSASADFYPSMVGHEIVAVTSGTSYTITGYTSSTIVTVDADASADTGDTFTVTADGNYTLPSTFGGEYNGPIAYTAGTNAGASIGWCSEGMVRIRRGNVSAQTGYPALAAIRKMDATDVARRWELIVYPTPRGDYTVEFPYELYFTALSADTDLHPAGAHYDEIVLAACESYAELKGEDMLAGRTQYYRQIVLPGAYRRNQRAAPRKLGSLLKRFVDIRDYRDLVERPNVTTP